MLVPFRVLFIVLLSACRQNTPSVSNGEQLEAGAQDNPSITTPIQTPEAGAVISPTPDTSPQHSLTIGYINSGSFDEYWKVAGTCSIEGALIRLIYKNQDGSTGHTYVPCIEGKWIYNDLYGPDIITVEAQMGTATASMSMNTPTPWTGGEIDCDPSGYTWTHEMTTAFGSDEPECHAIAYCSSGRPYVYSETLSSQCSFED